ncbi:DUF2690 domain-containing protein [Kitasatospora sp. NPDC048194]|uniref:helix-turn-helix domain-containing protein n=1 Tax=Kitasatospora sp. NPDC048194 TaxID=3364045 RepID=UPI003722A0F4
MASAWKELPEELPPAARRLADELRALKDATGLSLAELAGRTHYSRASWERWLNGKRVVTEQALEALVASVECDAAELRRLWRLAVEPVGAPADRTAPADPLDSVDPVDLADPVDPVDPIGPADPADPAEPGRPDDRNDQAERAEQAEQTEAEEAVRPALPWWRSRAALAAGAVVVALLVVLVGLRVTRHDEQASAADAPAPPAVPSAQPVPSAPVCRAVGCAHKDPKTTGCGKDARTLQTQVVGKVVVYLRYSRTCQAAWAAITEGEPKDYAVITDSTGDSETAMIHWGYDNYSAMLNAADPAVGFQVCGYQPAGHDCTGTVADLASVVASTPIPIGPASPPPGTGATAAATATATATATAGDPTGPTGPAVSTGQADPAGSTRSPANDAAQASPSPSAPQSR